MLIAVACVDVVVVAGDVVVPGAEIGFVAVVEVVDFGGGVDSVGVVDEVAAAVEVVAAP
jgi:hypothetical protein